MKPHFRFVHVSDLHLGLQHDRKFDAANARVACFFDDIASERRIARPDWLVVTGDLTTLGTINTAELIDVKSRFDALGIPYDVLPGNHDLCPSVEQAQKSPGVERYEPVPLLQTAFGAAFGERGIRFRVQNAAIEFLSVTLRAGDPDGELARLATDLAGPSDARARIVLGHYPSAPVRDAGPLAAWGPGHLGPTAAALDALLARHATDTTPVVAYLFGHVHALVGHQRAGVWHMTPGAVAVGCPGYRLFEVFEHEIRTQFYPLSDAELAACGFWGSNKPENVRDSQHPDFISYHAGTEGERTITVPLP